MADDAAAELPAAFAQSYAEARNKFLQAAAGAGLAVHAHRHPLLGRDGEELAVDVARHGAADAPSLLIVTSGCHGLEGFCGSGIQVRLLQQGQVLRQAAQAGVALLFVHALNPWGFSWWRRTTQENVDLNRNFVDFGQPLPANPGYDELAHALVPVHWPPAAAAEQVIAGFIARHGMKGFQTAVSSGQHDHPEGLFFAGRNPSWSQRTWREILREHAQRCRRLGWIDLHTGLGPNGHGERIFSAREDAATLARARQWWGEQVTSIYDGSSTSARLFGMAFEAVYQECPQAEYTGIALEYGTLPMTEVMTALRADQWLENHPETPDDVRRTIKRQTRDAFYTDSDDWKRQVVAQADEAVQQALAGLAAPGR
ncbi:MAG: M14 family metallopeptidase [Proteobacteria bacterium]|nr:M14 family metallopeptidase [Pseudomonadota bacterium]